MTDINTTKYLVKPNVETTKYFKPSDPSEDIYEELEKKEDITDHNADIQIINNNITNLNNRLETDEINISNNTSNISTINNNITNLSESVTNINNDISNIDIRVSKNESDIIDIQNQISGLTPGNEFQGMYKFVQDSRSGLYGIILNYGLGGILYWSDSRSGAYLNNVDGDFTLNSNIQSLTLPGYYKSPDGTAKYTNLYYYIEAVSDTNRQFLNNLKTIATEPGVYKIDFNLSAAPSLRNFNLMEGLQIINIDGNNCEIDKLMIPSSVSSCHLKNLIIHHLHFDYSEIRISIQLLSVNIRNRLDVLRSYFYTGDVNPLITPAQTATPPTILHCHRDFLYTYITSNTILGGYNQTNFSNTTTLILCTSEGSNVPSAQTNLSFRRIINLTPYDKSVITNIASSTWVG